MAYQSEPYRILAGSLNLLPPSDKTPTEDSLELDNWRVDQAGQLKSRKGMQAQSATIASGGRGHSLFRHSPNRRYLGAGSSLYAGEGFGNYGSIATGFDGQALGIEAMSGFTWIMNQSKQGKEKYSAQAGAGSFSAWTPAAPASALTAAAGIQSTVTLATFDSGEAWSMTDPDGVTTVASHDSIERISGQSLAFQCNPPGTWSADYTAFSKDASIAGAQQGSDKFRIWIFCSDAGSLSNIQILVDVNTKGFDLDYYAVAIPASALNQSARSWTQVEIYRDVAAVTNQQLSDGVLVFQRAGSTVGKDWSTVAGIRLTVKAFEAVDVQFDTFDVIGGLNSGTEGDYTFFVTYDTADGHETNGGPESNSVTVDHQAVALSNIPTSPDPQITSRHIYMSGGALGAPLGVATINDNTSTTYSLLTSDDVAQAENREMPIDHDPPPPAAGLIWHLGKLIAFNSIEHPGRYWWTPTGQPWYFPGSDDDFEGNWQDSGEDEDAVIGATSHNRTLIFYKARGIKRLYGDPDVSDPEATSSSIGLVGSKALCKAGPVDYLVGAEGVYSFNSETETKISTKIDPIFKGEFSILSAGGVVIPPMDGDHKDTAVLEHINGRLYFSYASNGYARPNITLVCELETLRWYQHKFDVDTLGGGFSALYYEGQDRGLTACTTTIAGATVQLLEAGSLDGTAPITLVWHSSYHDQGFPDNPKIYGELVITYKTGDQNGTSGLTASLYYDNGATYQAIGTLNAGARFTGVFPLGVLGAGISAKNVAIRVEGPVSTECIIYDAFIYWYVEARDGKTFDSGVTDLGSALAKQIDQLELEVTAEAPGTLTYYLRSDLPGASIVVRLTGTTPVTTARQNLRKILASMVDGRKYRLICLCDQKFQMHGVKVRITEVPEFIDGTAGETYLSREITYG